MNEYRDYGTQVAQWAESISEQLDQHGLQEKLVRRLEEVQALSASVIHGNASEEEIELLRQTAQSLYDEADKLIQDAARGEHNENHRMKSIEPGKHTLPPLPYPYDALEPAISAEIMRLHHDRHHKTYVDGLNKAELMMKKARETNNFELLKHWEREAAFHGSGHYLHTLFWEVMAPGGRGRPEGELLKQLEKDFGSFESFKKHFSEAAKQVEAVGWALLVWSPRSRRLEVLQAEKHQNLTQWDTIPLLVLDVWEHAYYLQYTTNRASYVENWWNVVNWPHVAGRFEAARKLVWPAF
ncbi:superoxide dismutase [Bacillus sp. V5-8f]|uniref:superoxide dismutase n=1 Tax=Bacillus sp. V5-8f TaxID=2053044 RepID=UPI000C78C586|nr:superoxide dismutase [Bacillus sp. V5-8f]PLT34823.1 superoxide dismutase [Bacillus sp. V5-8f]